MNNENSTRPAIWELVFDNLAVVRQANRDANLWFCALVLEQKYVTPENLL
jgi:hypothetical protein